MRCDRFWDVKMIELLQRLTDSLEEETNKIIDFLSTGEMYTSSVFDDPVIFKPEQDRPHALWGKRGVYAFKVIDEVKIEHNQVLAWNNVGYAGFNDYFLSEIHSGEYLYIGSCAGQGNGSSLYTRMNHHLTDNHEPSALKLGHPDRCFIRDKVEIYAFPIKTVYRQYYRIILTSIEKRMHELLRPKAGGNSV